MLVGRLAGRLPLVTGVKSPPVYARAATARPAPCRSQSREGGREGREGEREEREARTREHAPRPEEESGKA